MKDKRIGIIGGGLCGLTTAYLLKKKNINATIVEAQNRLGGRIHTKYSDYEAPIELGATWLGKKHKHLTALLSELGLDIYEQYMGEYAVYEPISTSPPQLVTMPYNPDPTFRIKGGSSALINALTSELEVSNIHLNTPVSTIKMRSEKIIVESKKQTFDFDFLISTLPPKLLIEAIETVPKLPDELIQIAQQTQTWMSESIKVALSYDQPFWRRGKAIGSIFSNTGLISEMYDHSNFEETKFALKGFIHGGYAFTTLEERRKRVIEQLRKYFGNQVENYISYQEKVWRHEPFTHSDYDGFVLPHQNNGHSIYNSEFLNGKLLIGGSETATRYPGYMDGAVESGITLAYKTKKALA
ncbi:MAG: NAD(P)/FAD-dependent oxidoreductase [Bacteroidota bacterium]